MTNGSRQKTDYGNNTTEVYAYNTDNTLKTLTNSAINAVIGIYSYTYDKAGNQTSKLEKSSTTDAGITTSYYYDELNRLKKVNETSKTTIYTYDTLGNRKTETARTTSGTGKYYTYNDQNRLVSVTSSAITYLSDLTPSAITGVAPDKDKQTKGSTTNGAITISGVKYEKGLGVATTNDVTYTWTSGTQNYFSVDLGLDDNCSNSGSGAQFQIYLGGSSTPAVDTTISAATGAKSILLNVSSVSSVRLKVTKTGTNTTEYPDWADAKLIKLDGTSTTNPVNFAYDNNGNLTTQTIGTGIGNTVNSYYYDELNQQRYVIANIAGAYKKYENIYNGDGYRVRQVTTSGGITNDVRYVYEYDKPVFELTSTASAITARNVYGLNLLKRTTSGQTYSYMYNGHADVVALLNSSGAAAQTYQYDAWGNITSQTGSVNNNITYAGYQYDKDTKLYYLNSRMYDPLTARFLQEDTYGTDPSDMLSLNQYTYVRNSPIMYDDPSGHHEVGQVLSYSQDYNSDVEELQKDLISLGYMASIPDSQYGYFGPKTEAAVQQYKDSYGLTNGAKVGDTTWAYIDRDCATQQAASSGSGTSFESIKNKFKDDLDNARIRANASHYTGPAQAAALGGITYSQDSSRTIVYQAKASTANLNDLEQKKKEIIAQIKEDEGMQWLGMINMAIGATMAQTQCEDEEDSDAVMIDEQEEINGMGAALNNGQIREELAEENAELNKINAQIAAQEENIVEENIVEENIVEENIVEENTQTANMGAGNVNEVTPNTSNWPSAKDIFSKDFEDYLTKNIGGDGSFSVGGRDFDGGIGNRWWEAKSGPFWQNRVNDQKAIDKFKSDMGDRLRIAQENGATYELFSNTPIPQVFKDYLNKKGIPFTEILH